MVVGANFGCGSSREHAPQALLDWGIHALVGVSFGEIFFGNCTTNGMPCLCAAPADIDWLQREVGRRPAEPLTVDVERQEVRFAGRTIKATIPDGSRNILVDGSWNTTGVLLEAGSAIEATAQRLPVRQGLLIGIGGSEPPLPRGPHRFDREVRGQAALEPTDSNVD